MVEGGLLAVEVSPPAAVGERIFKGERYNLGAAALLFTTISSLQGRAGGSTFTPKLVEVVFGPAWTLFEEKLSPCIARTALAMPSVRSRVLVSAGPCASMARRGASKKGHFRSAAFGPFWLNVCRYQTNVIFNRSSWDCLSIIMDHGDRVNCFYSVAVNSLGPKSATHPRTFR